MKEEYNLKKLLKKLKIFKKVQSDTNDFFFIEVPHIYCEKTCKNRARRKDRGQQSCDQLEIMPINTEMDMPELFFSAVHLLNAFKTRIQHCLPVYPAIY